MRKLLSILLTLLIYVCVAQPGDYYESCNGLTGDELKAELHNIIKELHHDGISCTNCLNI